MIRLTLALADFVGSDTLVAVTMTVCEELIEAGAVYRPLLETVPTAGLTDQVTPDDFPPEPPLTAALNCWLWEGASVAAAGLTDTEMEVVACKVMVALADWVWSAALVAFTVTVCWELIEGGAVYSPVLEMVPAAGLSDQITAGFVVPDTTAVNCWLCETVRLALVGLMATATAVGGCSVTLAVALAVGVMVAPATVTVVTAAMLAGAVYKPLFETVPVLALPPRIPFTLQTTSFAFPLSVNCTL